MWLERRVVNALIEDDDVRRRAAITEYVHSGLHAMPEHIRLGFVALSLVPWLLSLVGLFDRERALASVRRWEESRIGLIRQYPRALRSIVLFADGELP